MTDYINSAFHAICTESTEPERIWLSLYRVDQYYGGPEEGGWYGSDYVLTASQQFTTHGALDAAATRITALANDLTDQGKRAFGENCLRETEWLDARGLDDDFLPEPDGPTRYVVIQEEVRGSSESQGPRHYE